jgi:hypothetical protein
MTVRCEKLTQPPRVGRKFGRLLAQQSLGPAEFGLPQPPPSTTFH